MCHSKIVEEAGEREEKSYMLKQVIGEKVLIVLKDLSEYFTFSGPNGESDIDLTLGNATMMKYEYSWKMKIEWCESDHNGIVIEIHQDKQKEMSNKVTIKSILSFNFQAGQDGKQM